MTNFEKFKQQFDKDYENLYAFEDKVMWNNSNIPYNGRLEAKNDNVRYDSYGNEDSSLERVYYFTDFDIYVKFSGTRQSYNGTEWYDMREVQPTTKIINTFE